MIMSRETENIMIYTTALDEDIAAFFSNMADKYTQLLKGDLGIFDQYYYFALEADYRFEQLILQKTWPGTEAFRAMLSGDPYGILWESDFNSGTAALAALADGDGETAGRLASHAANYLYDAMSDTLSGTTLDMEATAFLQYAWIFTRHGDIITEEKLQACLQNLSFSIGVELKPIRWKDLNAGLRLGDYIMEANGKRFACGLHARLLLQDLKTAKMTVYRDDKTIQTKEMDTPYVAYYYHIFK